jgi:hypothetical protein
VCLEDVNRSFDAILRGTNAQPRLVFDMTSAREGFHDHAHHHAHDLEPVLA